MHPARQQQPAFSFHHLTCRTTFTKKLRTPYFIHRRPGMLHNVKLVVDDAAVRCPLLQALPEGLPHVHASDPDRAALEGAQLRREKLIQRLFLSLPAKPQRLTRLQIAHHSEELLLLAQMNLIHSHLPQSRLSPPLRPSLQITQIQASHRTRRDRK